MYFSSPVSNITPALVSVAMSRSDSRDSTTSSHCERSFTSAPMDVTFSTSPLTSQRMTRTATSSSLFSTRSSSSSRQDSYAGGWLTSPYRSCQMHSSFSSQGSDSSSYVSDDDLLSLNIDPLPTSMPPVETIPALQPKKEMTTEEQITMLREMQEKQDQYAAQQRRPQPQRQVRFATEARKQRTSSNMGSRRTTTSRRSA